MAKRNVYKIRKWKWEEDEIVKTFYPLLGSKETAEMLFERSKEAVRCRAEKFKLKSNIRKFGQLAEKSSNWKGGKYKSNGYLYVYNPYSKLKNDRYIYEHRFVMQKHLGRKLRKNELVHHKNGNKLDNRIENLELITRSKHAKLHKNNKWSFDYDCCIACGSNSEKHMGKGICYTCYRWRRNLYRQFITKINRIIKSIDESFVIRREKIMS